MMAKTCVRTQCTNTNFLVLILFYNQEDGTISRKLDDGYMGPCIIFSTSCEPYHLKKKTQEDYVIKDNVIIERSKLQKDKQCDSTLNSIYTI